MRVLVVKRLMYRENYIEMAQEAKITMRFFDRLRFLLFGCQCVIRIPLEELSGEQNCFFYARSKEMAREREKSDWRRR